MNEKGTKRTAEGGAGKGAEWGIKWTPKRDVKRDVPSLLGIALSRECGHCRHAVSGGAVLEQQIPGLSTLGSGFGSSIGGSLLCRLHDQLVDPADDCPRFTSSL